MLASFPPTQNIVSCILSNQVLVSVGFWDLCNSFYFFRHAVREYNIHRSLNHPVSIILYSIIKTFVDWTLIRRLPKISANIYHQIISPSFKGSMIISFDSAEKLFGSYIYIFLINIFPSQFLNFFRQWQCLPDYNWSHFRA